MQNVITSITQYVMHDSNAKCNNILGGMCFFELYFYYDNNLRHEILNLKPEVFCEKVFTLILNRAVDLIWARYIKFKIHLLATSPLHFM